MLWITVYNLKTTPTKIGSSTRTFKMFRKEERKIACIKVIRFGIKITVYHGIYLLCT